LLALKLTALSEPLAFLGLFCDSRFPSLLPPLTPSLQTTGITPTPDGVGGTKVRKASLGAEESVEVVYVDSVLEAVR